MNKRSVIFLLIAVAITLVVGAGSAIEALLDRKLPALLSRELGIEVALEPVDIRILKLTASTPRLLMGTATARAIDASGIEIGLSWPDLLAGKLRLKTAAVADLSVNLSHWPQVEDPPQADYLFLESLLPARLLLERGRYISQEGKAWPVQKLEWHRDPDDGARLQWIENRPAGRRQVHAEVASLRALLALRELDLSLGIKALDSRADDAALQLRITPQASGGYDVFAESDVAGMALRVKAGSKFSWSLPERSDVYLNHLRTEDVAALRALFSSNGEDGDLEGFLLATLPRPALAEHSSRIEIGEIRLADQVLRDTHISFSSDAQGLTLQTLTSQVPGAVLAAAGSLQLVSEGWRLQLGADLQSRQTDPSIATVAQNTDWYWRSGRMRFDGSGNSVGAILYALKGELLLQGVHRGSVDTPIKLQGQLDQQPNVFALDQFRVELGDALLQGTAALSGEREKLLKLRLDGQQLDLRQLFDASAAPTQAGFALPEYLGLFPDIDLDVQMTASGLQLPDLRLAQAKFALTRTPAAGRLTFSAQGIHGGRTRLQLDLETGPDLPSVVNMTLQLEAMDLASAFQQDVGLLESRVSGELHYASQGSSVAEIFDALQGKANLTLELRTDANWERPSGPEEKLRLSGESSLVVANGRITGVQVQEIYFDTIKQHLSGDISMVAGRTPWLVAHLMSERLDIMEILAWIPSSPDTADTVDPLTSLRNFGDINVSFAGATVEVMDTPLRDVVLSISSERDRFAFERLNFGFEGSRFDGRVALKWKDELAELKLFGSVANLVLDSFLFPETAVKGVPLSGSVRLSGRGAKLDDILATLSAQLSLQGKATTPRRQLQADLQRLPQGMKANIKKLAWNDSELSGTVLYHNTAPESLQVRINSGTLDLRPWEDYAAPATQAANTDASSTRFSSAAMTSSQLVGNILTLPKQLLAPATENSREGRFFSEQPLDLAFLAGHEAQIRGQLAAVISGEGVAKDLAFDVALGNGKLQASARAGFLNGGSASAELELVSTSPGLPTAGITVAFKDVHRRPEQLDAPRTGFISVHSQGNSEAELAAHLTGMSYVELGRGAMDFGRMSLLSADVASVMYRRLIPGLARRAPEVQCGILLATFTDGIGITPYGYAVRTGTANLMGKIEVDLRTEQLLMQFRSRSREGMGLSLDNTFSSTVNITGPLSNPRIMPDAKGLLFRGWAAFMTGGISLLGETMYNRTLASANPCIDIRNSIRKDLCASDGPLAASPIVCPPTDN